jgi:PTS system mannose-specific IIB component
VIILNRIDSRLIHGQVIEVWLPHLEVRRVVVADDAAAADTLTKAAFGLVMPPKVEIRTSPVAQTDFAALGADAVRTLILFRTVQSVVQARAHGLPNGTLNVGNVHSAPGKVGLNRSVFLDDDETKALGALRDSGMKLVIQAVPGDAPTTLAS